MKERWCNLAVVAIKLVCHRTRKFVALIVNPGDVHVDMGMVLRGSQLVL